MVVGVTVSGSSLVVGNVSVEISNFVVDAVLVTNMVDIGLVVDIVAFVAVEVGVGGGD